MIKSTLGAVDNPYKRILRASLLVSSFECINLSNNRPCQTFRPSSNRKLEPGYELGSTCMSLHGVNGSNKGGISE